MSRITPNPQPAKRHQLVPRGRVLLVDEDPRDLAHYRAILQEQGYEVWCSSGFEEAVVCVGREVFDCVFVSQGSRSFEGRTILERAMEIDRHIPVVVLTRCLDMGCYLEAMQLGAVDYLEKPLTASQMAWLVETHLRPRTAH